MSWLTPGLAAVAAAALIPSLVILYFLKLRRREVEVSTTLLWKKSIQDMQANAPFQKLRRNLLLLLQLLVLFAGLFALAQPEVNARDSSGSRTVLLIDRSASMHALDGEIERGGVGGGGGDEATRLDQAKEEALRLIDALREPAFFSGGEADEAMVIVFDTGAEVRQPFTSDKATLRAAIESIEPTHAPTAIEEALRLADPYANAFKVEEDRGLVRSGPSATIHMWSDGAFAAPEESLLNPESLFTYHRVGGAETGNTAITALRAERAFDRPNALSLFVGLQTTDPTVTSVNVELMIDGEVRQVREIVFSAVEGGDAGGDVEGGDGDAGAQTRGSDSARSAGWAFSLDRTAGGLASVRLVARDALDIDNEAAVIIPPARRPHVALVTPGNLFLSAALEGLSLERLALITPEEMQRQVERGETEFDVFVLDGVAPPRVAEAAAPGRYLVFGAVPLVAGVTRDEGADVDEPVVPIDWNREHPALQLAGFENLVIGSLVGASLEGSSARSLMNTDGGPGVVEASEGQTRVLATLFNPAESNWPFEPGFILFLASAIDWLADDAGDATLESAQPGGVLVTTLPPGVGSARLTPPPGGGPEANLLTGPDGRVVYGPLRFVGVYTLRWDGPSGPFDRIENGRSVRPVAVNLLDARESDVRSASRLDLASRAVEAEEGSALAKGKRRIWPWLLVAALGLLFFEWWFYNKRMAV